MRAQPHASSPAALAGFEPVASTEGLQHPLCRDGAGSQWTVPSHSGLAVGDREAASCQGPSARRDLFSSIQRHLSSPLGPSASTTHMASSHGPVSVTSCMTAAVTSLPGFESSSVKLGLCEDPLRRVRV